MAPGLKPLCLPRAQVQCKKLAKWQTAVLICQFLCPGTVTLLYQTQMFWHLQNPNFSQKYSCNPTHLYIIHIINIYLLYMYSNNVDLGWGQHRRTSRIWCLFDAFKIRKEFCAGLSLFKETSAEKNRWNLKKRILNHVRKCDNGDLQFLEKNFGGPNPDWLMSILGGFERLKSILHPSISTDPGTWLCNGFYTSFVGDDGGGLDTKKIWHKDFVNFKFNSAEQSKKIKCTNLLTLQTALY